MSTIGGITVDIIRGMPVLKKLRTETWITPGLDGYGAQTLGQGDSQFDLSTIFYAQATGGDGGASASDNANTHIDACTALQGTVVEIEDDWGDDYVGMLVLKVDPAAAKKPCIYQGNFAVRVEIAWKLVTT